MAPPPTRGGHSAYLAISALQKSIRRSRPEEAAAWAIELAASGLGPWCWKRLQVIAVEDCSPEATGLVSDVAALHAQWKASNGEELLAVAAAATKLALAPKNRLVNWLVILYGGDDSPPLVPRDEAKDMHTGEGRRMQRGLRHFLEEAARLEPWTGDLAALEVDVADRANERRLLLDDEPRRPPPPDPQLKLDDDR